MPKMRAFLPVLYCIVALFFSLSVHGADRASYIAIIMDDLGSSLDRGERLIQLPNQITYSFLPYSPYAKTLAYSAHQKGKEVMLHLPMEPISNKNMGPGGLQAKMEYKQFIATLREALMAVPFAVGVNNHMGSLLTRSTKNMHWLMQELKMQDNLYFVDSRTHGGTVAAQMASRNRLKNATRDIFLDHVIEKNAIDLQFRRLIKQAKSTGYALAIGHPHLLTIQALEYWLTIIEERGVQLVPVSEYIRLTTERKGNKKIWQASLTPLQKVAKN